MGVLPLLLLLCSFLSRWKSTSTCRTDVMSSTSELKFIILLCRACVPGTFVPHTPPAAAAAALGGVKQRGEWGQGKQPFQKRVFNILMQAPHLPLATGNWQRLCFTFNCFPVERLRRGRPLMLLRSHLRILFTCLNYALNNACLLLPALAA